MYSQLPPRWKVVVKTTLSLAWGTVGLGGVVALFATARPFIAVWGEGWPLVWGTLLALAAALSVFGVLSDRYRWEWVGSWLAGAALAPYVVTVWWLLILRQHELATTATLLTALLLCTISRSVACAAHAAKLRLHHQIETEKLNAIEEAIDGSE